MELRPPRYDRESLEVCKGLLGACLFGLSLWGLVILLFCMGGAH